MSDPIERKVAINETLSFIVEYCGAAFDEDMQNKLYQRLILLPSTQSEITPDGTLKVTVDADIASIGRILLSQAGTQRGRLYYKDEQPEIIRCRDCRKYRRLGCPMGITVFDAPAPDGYCYKAERRTDEPDKQTD